ncbi:MAG: DNA primase [Chloroflexi bacterium]|nr:DNA primase [Chloroflexota bacterium]|tara:strand:- start:9016 stop:10797 length:1782 start_codon:yes stop_codon:yes gene_type:complete
MSIIDDIKTKAEIVQIVSPYVTLQQTGKNLKGLCPFHSEKTPSFFISPERQTWRCFGACSDGGDIISFMMKIENKEFAETIQSLANTLGIDNQLNIQKDISKNSELFEINELAANFFSNLLESQEGNTGREYLIERGLNTKTIKQFKLGLSPKQPTALIEYFRSINIPGSMLAQVGLASENQKVFRDFFSNRIMFPIQNPKNKIIGFGGRSLNNNGPKYLNTPTTSIFDKKSTLYAYNHIGRLLASNQPIIIVEGYMDAITAHQHGYDNVVASLGTSITKQHLSQLKKVSKKIIQALDPDQAGQNATLRSLESTYSIFEEGYLGQRKEIELHIASLPANEDPDSLIRNNGAKWKSTLDQSLPFIEFLINGIGTLFVMNTSNDKTKIAEKLLPFIAHTRNSFEQEKYFTSLAKKLNVKEQTLKVSIHDISNSKTRPKNNTLQPSKMVLKQTDIRSTYYLEDYLTALLIQRPELKEQYFKLDISQFTSIENKELLLSWEKANCEITNLKTPSIALKEHLEYIKSINLHKISNSSSLPTFRIISGRLSEQHLRNTQELLLSSTDNLEPLPTKLESQIISVNEQLRNIMYKDKDLNK